MRAGINSAPTTPAELLGDPHPLLDQLGSADELAVTGTVASAIEFHLVASLPALRSFLEAYRTEILIPIELPAIVSAYHHAARGEVKELIALDRTLVEESAMRKFAMASCRVGQRQLGKLRPMRDQRLVQRYLTAIEEGRAKGWHTIVYGVSLAMFSLPLRQGLQHYIEQTARGFIESSARSLHLAEADCDALLAEQTKHVPGSLAAALPPVIG